MAQKISQKTLAKALAKLGVAVPKNTAKASGNLVATAINWIAEKRATKVVKQEANTYTRKDQSVHKGTLLTCENGEKYQVGEARFFKVK